MKNCLIIGAGGLIGRQISKILNEQKVNQVKTCFKRGQDGFVPLDITSPEALEDIFEKNDFDHVFHCANLAGGVNFCENNQDKAFQFHQEATKNIGERCMKQQATLTFISTDYVFDGTKDEYKEEDETNPLNIYGKLKLEAEEWIQENMSRYIIARTTNVFGWDPETVTPNFLMGTYRNLEENKTCRVPSFLLGTPTYAEDLSCALVELAAHESHGLYHIVGPDLLDRYTWAKEFCELGGWDSELIEEVKKPPEGMVPRPLKSYLNTEKFQAAAKTHFRGAKEATRLFLSKAGKI